MPSSLPAQPSLIYLKKEAKDLLKAHRSEDPSVCPALRAYLPRLADRSNAVVLAAPFSLHDAQQVVARQYGFKNWTELRRAVEQPEAAPRPAKPSVPRMADLSPAMREHIEELGFRSVGGYRIWCHQQGLGSSLDKKPPQLLAEREQARQLGGQLEPQVSRAYRRGQADRIRRAHTEWDRAGESDDWLVHLFALTADEGERQALLQLLLQVEKYTLLRWEAAAELAPHYRSWRRPVEQFFPRRTDPLGQLVELARYLLGRDDIPTVENASLKRAFAAATNRLEADRVDGVLTAEQIEFFKQRGYLHLKEAFPAEEARRMHDFMWAELRRRHGFELDDPATWVIEGSRVIQPGDLKLNKTKDNPVYAAMASERLMSAYAQITGRRGARLKQSWGGFGMAFPDEPDEPWELPRKSWRFGYIGLPGHHGILPRGLHVLTFFSPMGPQNGGRLAVAGSHRLVLEFAQSLGPMDLQRKMNELEARFAHSHPWLTELVVGRAPDRDERIRRFMAEETVVNGVPVQVVEWTGEPGDAVLIHPALYTSRSSNKSAVPRLVRS